ncbi:MAG: TRAP transporter substrate-binding protein [Proteobacteria bacterium]|nr:TRAP transporter substrate-binding protein [Desulfobacula sp.]MBU3951370.1 TRAP transporter substrate-binding protein [Pseudomonadota bacterium]
MKRITIPAFLVFCLCTLFAVTASAKTQLTYANFFPPTHIQSQLAESWCKEVEKRTNGEITINYFPAGSLTKAPQTYDGVVSGIADIGMTVLAYSRGRFPIASAIDLPMGYSNGVQATAVANAVLNKFEPAEFNDTAMMFVHAHGPGLIHTRDKAVSTLEGIKGLKLRGTGTSGLVQAALGASPVGTSMAECYQMLQKGVVDGSSHPVESNKGWKLGEVAHFMTQNFSTAYTTTFAVFMNKDKWAALTPEQQKIIQEINGEWATKHGEAWDEADKLGMEFFLEKGGKVVPLSEAESKRWEEAVAPVIDDYIKSASEKGIDGKAVVDFIKANM